MTTQAKALIGWQDFAELLIALWLVGAPLILGFFHLPTAALSSIAVGALAFLFSQLGIANQQAWEEWINLALALLLLASPWLFGYVVNLTATVNALIGGGLLAVFAIIAMVHDYRVTHHKHTPYASL